MLSPVLFRVFLQWAATAKSAFGGGMLLVWLRGEEGRCECPAAMERSCLLTMGGWAIVRLLILVPLELGPPLTFGFSSSTFTVVLLFV